MKSGILLVILAALAGASASGAPSIGTVSDNAASYPNNQIPRYERYEASFTIGGVGVAGTDYNPYNPNLASTGSAWHQKNGIYVDALITPPSGQSFRWPCFYDYSRGWKLRFAPTESGTYTYRIEVRSSSGTSVSSQMPFVCVENLTGRSKRGFLGIEPQDSRFFSFQDGTIFHPIGVHTGGDVGATDDIASLGAAGGNFVRVFNASKMVEQWAQFPDHVNNFQESKMLFWDNYLDRCRDAGVYVLFLLQDWTRWKSSVENPYIADGVCGSLSESFSSPTVREVFKRKLRYFMARFGYSTNLVGFDIMNECQFGSPAQDFHTDAAKFILGNDANVPSSWPVPTNDLDRQPHIATGDKSSTDYRIREIPWADPSIGMTNYHDYARKRADGTYLGWGSLASDVGTWETMGSTLAAPWMDMAVWADRMARVHRKCNYGKPLSWSEFGLIYISSTGRWGDWTDAYTKDAAGRHCHDWYWGMAFTGISGCHWHSRFWTGYYGGGTKWHILTPLANFLSAVDFRGLTQETVYPVSDSLNPSPKITCTNPKIMIAGMRGTNKAYFYVKNLTDTWYRACGYTDGVPTPAPQTGTIQLKGLQPGTYTVEKWSTSDTNPSTQRRSIETKTVGTDGILTLALSVGVGTDFDWAYKVKPVGGSTAKPNIKVTLSVDSRQASPSQTVIYTVNYTNAGAGSASNVVVSVPLPNNTTFLNASSGGAYDAAGRKISWNIGTVAAGATGSVTFQAKID